jgi:undecaprenyl diphosphate synthase
MQSNLQHSEVHGPLHVGIIMDGNGRWGTARGLSRTDGHRAGVLAVRRAVAAAPALGIDTLTLFAFSSDNWKRSKAEVDGMMKLIEFYTRHESAPFVAAGIRLTVIGRRDRLPASTVAAIDKVEKATAGGRLLNVRIAIDYSGRDAILAAARSGATQEHAFSEALGYGSGYRDVDLVVRTSGEQRLSGFLLWECAYAELYFEPRLWPDFTGDDLARAVAAFSTRNRRFGGPASRSS